MQAEDTLQALFEKSVQVILMKAEKREIKSNRSLRIPMRERTILFDNYMYEI